MTWSAEMRKFLAWFWIPLLGLAGCDMRDMYDQAKIKALRPSSMFADGRGARPLIPGTVARGHLDDDTLLYQGKVGGKLAEVFPFRISEADLARGQVRFNIYCAPCHDRTGSGDGMVVKRGFSRPPSFHLDRLRTSPVGHFYDTITNGFGVMPAYNLQVPVRDRWLIVAYVRALQFSQNAPLDAVPADERAKLGEK